MSDKPSLTFIGHSGAIMKKGLVIIALVLAMAPAAYAELTIDITQGNVDPLPVALMAFEGSPKAAPHLWQDAARCHPRRFDAIGLV